MIALGPLVRRVAVSLPFRVVVAVGCLYFHVAMMTRSGATASTTSSTTTRTTRRSSPPGERREAGQVGPAPVVARWDAQHYEALALRGYATCKDKWQLAVGEYPDDDKTCELAFYPTYGVGRRAFVMKVTHLPVDYALYYLSLAASFVFLVMWTSRPMIDGLGVLGRRTCRCSCSISSTPASRSSPSRRSRA